MAKENPKIAIKSELGFKNFSRSPVDIIIPFYNQQYRVGRLCGSILNSVRSNPYQITLVDDGSADKEYFETYYKDFDKNRPADTEPILKTIRSEENQGWGAACYLGYKNTLQPWILFMHSDCVVEDPLFMVEMGRALLELKNQNVRLVVPRTDHVMDWQDPRLLGEKGKRVDNIVLKDVFAPLFCFMVHRELFNKTGFLSKFPYAGYEDEEFGYRMTKKGFKQAICGRAFVSHEGGGTTNMLKKNPQIAQKIDENRILAINAMKHIR